MHKIRVFLTVVLAFVILSCGDKGGGGGGGGTVDNGGCPATHVKTTAQNICLPKEWGPQQFHQIDRQDGGVVLVELPLPDDDAFQKGIGDTVIAGLQQAIDSATHHNPTWVNYTKTSAYIVLMIRKQATNQDGTPALVTSGIQTAGTVVNVFTDGVSRGVEPMIVLAQPDNTQDFNNPVYLNYLKASARHEGEHGIEYKNDLGVFLAKIGAGDVHPHWTLPGGGLLADQTTACRVDFGGTAVAIEGTKTIAK